MPLTVWSSYKSKDLHKINLHVAYTLIYYGCFCFANNNAGLCPHHETESIKRRAQSFPVMRFSSVYFLFSELYIRRRRCLVQVTYAVW